MPVITISRQFGSDGNLIAQMLADRLGYTFVDRGVIIAAGEEQGMAFSKGLVPEIEERKPGFWERLDEERRRYGLLLRYVLYDFAERDNCVILGHGAEYFLTGLNQVLRAKLIAPFESRVRRVMERDKLSREAAMGTIRQSDRERAAYVKYLCQEDWMVMENYDLIVSTDRLTIESAVDIIAKASTAPELAATPGSRKVLCDRALACRVEIRLLLDPRIGSSSLRVMASSGEVIVSGTLATEDERTTAELIAESTPGVTRVISELVVVPISSPIYP